MDDKEEAKADYQREANRLSHEQFEAQRMNDYYERMAGYGE